MSSLRSQSGPILCGIELSQIHIRLGRIVQGTIVVQSPLRGIAPDVFRSVEHTAESPILGVTRSGPHD